MRELSKYIPPRNAGADKPCRLKKLELAQYRRVKHVESVVEAKPED